MADQQTDDDVPVAESGPSIIIIIIAAVGGFFALIILYCAMKAVCSSCKDQIKGRHAANDPKNKIKPEPKISTIKIDKPKVTYDGPFHNNIPVVRAREDVDPNMKALKPRRPGHRNDNTNLASMVQQGKENGRVDHETYRTRREIEDEIIENRRREKLRQHSRDSEVSVGSGRERFHIENERNGFGYEYSDKAIARNLDDDRARRKRSKLQRMDVTLSDDHELHMREREKIHYPSRERQNSVTRMKDGGDFPPVKRAADLSRFRPQEMPSDWLPPSKRAPDRKASPPREEHKQPDLSRFRPQELPENWLPPSKKATKHSPPIRSHRIAAMEIDDRDLRPDFRRGEEKKILRQAKSSSRESYENSSSRGFENLSFDGQARFAAPFVNNADNVHHERIGGDEKASRPQQRRLPPVFQSQNSRERMDIHPPPNPPPQKKKRRVITTS